MSPEREIADLKERNAKLEILVQGLEEKQKYQTVVGLPGFGYDGVFVDASQLVPEGGGGGGGDVPTDTIIGIVDVEAVLTYFEFPATDLGPV